MSTGDIQPMKILKNINTDSPVGEHNWKLNIKEIKEILGQSSSFLFKDAGGLSNQVTAEDEPSCNTLGEQFSVYFGNMTLSSSVSPNKEVPSVSTTGILTTDKHKEISSSEEDLSVQEPIWPHALWAVQTIKSFYVDKLSLANVTVQPTLYGFATLESKCIEAYCFRGIPKGHPSYSDQACGIMFHNDPSSNSPINVFQVSTRVSTHREPCDITVCGGCYIVTSEGIDGLGIYRYDTTNNSLTHVQHVGLNTTNCTSISASSKGDMLVAAYMNEQKILILSAPPNPVITKEIFLVNGTDEKHFQYPQYVSVNCANDDIIVTDLIYKYIKVFTKDGIFRFKYDSQFTAPSRTTTDSSGRIFVLDIDRMIHVLTKDGQLICHIPIEKVCRNKNKAKPSFIAMRKNGQLVTATFDGYCTVNVCKFQ